MTSPVVKLRQQLLMTQSDFAKELGCSRVSIMNYETQRTTPKASIIKKMLDLAHKNKIKIKIEDFFAE